MITDLLCCSSSQRKSALVSLIECYTRRYGEPARGTTRLVFYDGDSVRKVPNPYTSCCGLAGIFANRNEVKNYEDRVMPIAPCQMLVVNDVPVVVMDRVSPREEREYPSWVHANGCPEAGVDAHGQWVVYDAGWAIT
jgi:hypothetical protein